MNGNLKILFGKTVLNKFKRLIARLDIKGPNLIKGIHLEGLRVIGNPNEYALKYYKGGIDEIIYIDPVASLYERNILTDIIERTCKEVFVPITVGGGIKSLNDVEKILKSGADKVAINTSIVKNPTLITEIAKEFGSQCMVASIEVKKINKKWEIFTLSGREKTGIEVKEWINKIQILGAGEILLTSIDKEGTKKGFDNDLIQYVSDVINVPTIISGGFGKISDLGIFNLTEKIDAIAIADGFHYERFTINQIKEEMHKKYGLVRI